MSNNNTGQNLFPTWGQVAEDFFVMNGFTILQIKKMTGVSKTTLGKWRVKGEWNRLKEEYDSSNQSLAIQMKKAQKQFAIELDKPYEWKEKAQITAAIDKCFNIISKIEGSISKKKCVLIAFDEMTKYFKLNHDDEAIELLARISVPFMQHIVEIENGTS